MSLEKVTNDWRGLPCLIPLPVMDKVVPRPSFPSTRPTILEETKIVPNFGHRLINGKERSRWSTSSARVAKVVVLLGHNHVLAV